ncbi:alpha-hydroxy-acid oxidizing protein [Solihabitans fulvus]|uniref:Alpha-hydroxy-acid oxidizing protein n=1 Tax=Solihabitans fulvus TaxID=1892852 RepID=A0A5B2X246_9PSEU|nr:alpha-hydroxy acid oxidase [Solihabitans fulvus]KAA2257279.1 alpha-hydroxy-acid oxidizing protein [Solihabitans fulvus]
MEPFRVEDYAEFARASLSAEVWGFVQGGSGAEWTLAANRAAYDRVRLRTRVLTDVSRCDLGTTVLGARLASPLGVAPMAYHRLAHPDGELATAAAAGATGSLFVVSIFASETIEDIAAAATGPLWLQLYWLRQREILVDLIRRAEAAGYGALVLTVDAPRVGRRLRDLRNAFALPQDVRAVNIAEPVMAASHESADGTSAIERHSREQFDQTVTWSDLAWLRERSSLPLVLKGILTAEDARLAVEHGVDAVVVSNHGGRQLDGAVPSLDALPEVVAAVAGRLPVLVDGGVRTGGDVFKSLALGACAVLVGRPVLWGLAHSGAAGAGAVLGLLREELDNCMALAGRPTLADIDSSAVVLRQGF